MRKLDLDLNDLLEFDLDQDIPGFELDTAELSAAVQTDFVRIRRYPRPSPAAVCYERAVDLVHNLPDLAENEALYCLVSGSFIYGDFIEALLVERNWYAKEMLIATLSLSKENVDSLANLLNGDYLGDLGLIVSDYWYSHERRSQGGVPYLTHTLGGPNFSFAAAGLHTKVTIINTSCGQHLVLHGSANLRSSRNLEQLVIARSKELYDFNRFWMLHLLEHFRINRKSLRGDALWQALPEQAKKAD